MKMASQRFCLRWNNHQSNLLSVFDQLLHAETFTDVTLAVDGQYLKAHKMVLSACSPYFNALFLNHPEKHPIVILKDVPYADMKSLLDFMYRGEVSVDQERLTAFLRVAESLRIKGLTEVNDDKPTNSEPAPQPPQLQRIQPYMVQQQQQRHKSHQSSSAMNTSSNSGQNSSSQQQQQQQHLQQQQQQSLLSSALASMPKRKRGRPRKLSGSDDGDYDEFDGEMGDGKMCNDSYSGNDDGSDDNQRDSGNNDDMNESRDSVSPSKKSKQQMKDIRHQQQQEDNSTSVHLITSTPELSQRLFGVNKNNFNNSPTTTIPITTTTTTAAANNNSNSTLISLQAPTQQTTATKIAAIEFNEALTAHLPTVLGLKIKSNLQQQNNAQIVGQQQQQQQQMQQQAQQQQQVTTVPINTNPNSLLKQQLRAGLKELIDVTITNATNNATTNTLSQPNAPSSNANTSHLETQEACSALQSLANVAERQAQNNIQPPSANNLHHQFLLHMAANPILKSSGEFFHQQNALLMREEEHNLELLMDQSDKSDPEMLTLADENAGLDYSTGNETGGGNQTGSNEQLDTSANSGNNNNSGSNNTTPRAKTSAGKPIQRRRIRRKAQSSLDDQAEQLTEMSVRGLDLFRYASINEGVYQCTECAKENMQKTFKNKYSFQRHAFLYHEGKHRKVFPCPLCGKEFSRPDKMKNHMKMTHESFVAKEIQNFNPLNYLITAAGEIQASFTTSSTTTNAQTPSNVVTTPPQPLLNQLQANNPALSIMINNNNNNNDNNEEAGLNLTQQQQQQQQQENLNDFNLPKPLKFPTDIEIKNEIVISPSPSPPPATQTVAHTGTFSSNNTSTPISLAETLSMLKTSVQTTSTNNAQLNSQRLEEVK